MSIIYKSDGSVENTVVNKNSDCQGKFARKIVDNYDNLHWPDFIRVF